MHQGCCDAADEDLVGLSVGDFNGEIDRLRNLRVFEGEQRRHIDPIPGLVENGAILTFDETDPVTLSSRSVILGNLHEPQRRIFVLVTRLDQKNILIGH